jgi:hypothetical protein
MGWQGVDRWWAVGRLELVTVLVGILNLLIAEGAIDHLPKITPMEMWLSYV